MMKTLSLLIVIAALSSVAMAKRPYSTAGCGLGTLVVGKEGSQVLAATTNGTSGSQTFGITSGTSNCTDSGVVKEAHETSMFIESNQVALSTEISRGQGETIASLGKIMGCEDSSVLGASLKNNYSKIYPTQNVNSADVADGIRSVVKGNPALSSCRI